MLSPCELIARPFGNPAKFCIWMIALGCYWGSNASGQSSNPTGIQLFPNTIKLTNAGSFQHVTIQWVSEAKTGSTTMRALDGEPTLVMLDANVASVEKVAGTHTWVVKAIRSGQTELTVQVGSEGGQNFQATAKIECSLVEVPAPIEFNNHVQSILAKNGCNMGACHGALAGKGGFRLSLRGYDPASDHFNLTRQDRGRRIERDEPAKSLLLLKPSGAIEHKGGVRLLADSNDYATLAAWIAKGAAGPLPSDPTLEHLEILPESIRLEKNQIQPLIVRAHYSNGRIEDVSHWAKFTATDESIATVDEHGVATIVGAGEGAINAWFASRIVTSRFSVPFSEKAASKTLSTEGTNRIDLRVSEKLESLGLEASQPCSDAEFIRRTSLDATGTLPTEQQVIAFLQDTASDKRSRWIDHLLDSPEYVDYWTYRWSDLLMLNSNLLRADGIKAYYGWIRNHVQKNTPWDQFVREIVTARGEALENGATNFYAINQDPESMTENVCQAFLGLSIGCAKCHNHPLEKWTNDQYYAMANLFARVRAKGWGGEVRDADSARTLLVLDRGDLIQPLRGKPQLPAPLDAPPLDINANHDRREYLADWLTAPENPYFARAIVNRVWAAFLGVGIVNPVDDLRLSNPASNTELLQDLSDYLIKEKYNLKELMRLIMNSQTYQLSSNTTESNKTDKKYFSHYYPKRLMAEVIHDAISSVSEVPTVFDKVAFLGGDKRPTTFYAKGTRAIQLFDSSVESNFLKTFGRNQRRITCECERSDEPSIIQVLNLSNGDTLNNKLSGDGSVVDQLMTAFPGNDGGLVTSAYLRCLARYPTPNELEAMAQELRSAPESEKRTVVEDLLWSLMTSREFLFNH